MLRVAENIPEEQLKARIRDARRLGDELIEAMRREMGAQGEIPARPDRV